MSLLETLMKPKVLFIIACVVIVGFVIFYMWRKNKTDLKRLKSEQEFMNRQFEHGVLLNPADATSCASEETQFNLTTPTPEEAEVEAEPKEKPEEEEESEEGTDEYYLSSIPAQQASDDDQTEDNNEDEDDEDDEQDLELLKQVHSLKEIEDLDAGSESTEQDDEESYFENINFADSKAEEDEVTISDEELRTKILIDQEEDAQTSVSEKPRPKVVIKKKK